MVANSFLNRYRWRISIFTDGELTYHRYRRTGFSRATVASHNNANFLICQRILRTYDGRLIYLSVRTDNIYLPMVNWLTINTDGTVGQCFGGLPYARAMLTTSFVNGLYQFTDMVDSFLHRYGRTISIYRWRTGLPSVPTDRVLEGYLMPSSSQC